LHNLAPEPLKSLARLSTLHGRPDGEAGADRLDA